MTYDYNYIKNKSKMGNKIDSDKGNYASRTPIKNSLGGNNGINEQNKNKSAQKDGLYAEEKLFENFDSNLNNI